LAYHVDSEEYLKAKGDVRCIRKIAERIAKKFYGNDFDYTQYKGFDTVSETQNLCNEFNINIAYYSYNEEKNSYKQESLIQKENNEETTTLVSILLHTGTTLKFLLSLIMLWLLLMLKN
jgi:hypothetical protein